MVDGESVQMCEYVAAMSTLCFQIFESFHFTQRLVLPTSGNIEPQNIIAAGSAPLHKLYISDIVIYSEAF